MISLDWKDRIEIDTIDFVERKLPKNDYDIDIIYNAYPERIDGKIPKEIISFTAKIIASKISKNIDKYMEFYKYLWDKKGENGRIIAVYIVAKGITKKKPVFIDFTKEILFSADNIHDTSLVLDKIVYPILKKDYSHNIDKIFEWLKDGKEPVKLGIAKLLITLCGC